jgi:hypothetical protein
MKKSWQKLRTVRGQLALLGVIFAGAAALAVVILCLRGALFERYAREKYPPLEGYAEEAGRVLAAPESSAEQVAEVGKRLEERMKPTATPNGPRSGPGSRELDGLYGAWVADETLDPAGHLARRLTRLQPDWVFRRLRVTLVAGSPPQQSRALAWLRLVASEAEFADRAAELAAYAARKGERRGDRDIQEQAEAVIAVGVPRDGVR